MGRDYEGGETRRWFYDYRDLTPYFTPGKNVIAAEVFRHWPIGSTGIAGASGLSLRGRSEPAGTGQADRQVRRHVARHPGSRSSPTQPPTTPARNRPAGDCRVLTIRPGPPAARCKDIWAPLVASEIPPLMEARYPVLRIEGLAQPDRHRRRQFPRGLRSRARAPIRLLKVKGGKGAAVDDQAPPQATHDPGRGRAILRVPLHERNCAGLHGRVEERQEPLEIVDVGREFHLAAAWSTAARSSAATSG